MKLAATFLANMLCLNAAWSCSCTIKDPPLPDDDWAWEVLNKAEHVVQGRVSEVKPGNKASISITLSLKGAKHELTLVALSAPGSMCGTSFALDEEFIYVVGRTEPLSLCGKLEASARMQQAVAQLLASPRPVPMGTSPQQGTQ